MSSANGFQAAHTDAGTSTQDLSTQDLFYAADRALGRGDLKQAMMLCQQLLQANETYAPAYFMLATITMELYQHDKALKFNELAERFQPNSFDVYFQRGKIHFVKGNMDEALEAFERAQSLQPSNAVTAMLIGDVLAQQGKIDEAIAQFSKATLLQDLPEILEHKGICQQAAGDYEGAKQSFKAMLSRLPNYAPALSHLATIALHEEDEDKAEDYLRKALMINPNHQEALVALSSICLSRHDLESATSLSRLAIKVNPNHLKMVMGALRSLTAAGFLDEVETALRHLYQHHPDNLQVLVRLATILAPRGKREEALALVEKALLQVPDNSALLHTRAALRGESTATAPVDYVANMFDGYAEQFDYHLQEQLGYHTPTLISQALRAALPSGVRDLSLLDLGCGTGLAAQALQDITTLRVGVDLSPKMIAKSKTKHIYTDAHVDELVHFMQNDTRHYDLVVAADVLVYIGDLNPLFSHVVQRMKEGGLCALSVERETSERDYTLQPSGRYSHSENYVQSLAALHGLSVVYSAACDLRKEAGAMIVGTLFVLRK